MATLGKWYYASDPHADEWFGGQDSREEAIADAKRQNTEARFVVAQATIYDERDLGGGIMDVLLEHCSEDFVDNYGGTSDYDPFEVSAEDREKAEEELLAWLRRWCKPGWIVVDGTPEWIEP